MSGSYYDMNKHLYKLRYEEKKIKDKEREKIPPNYYVDYWRNKEWKKVIQPKDAVVLSEEASS
jgi:hypothetical protein